MLVRQAQPMRLAQLARVARLGVPSYSTKSPLSVAFTSGDEDEALARYRTQKNPVVPNLHNLESRWLRLDAGQQDDIVAYLEDKMRGDWHDITNDEKRAVWHVWYGPWGPRAPPGTNRDLASIYSYLAACVGLSVVGLLAYRFADFNADEEVPGIDYDAEAKQ